MALPPGLLMRIIVAKREAISRWKRWALAQRNELPVVAGFSPGFVLAGAKAHYVCA
jgi:hypothetical protein